MHENARTHTHIHVLEAIQNVCVFVSVYIYILYIYIYIYYVCIRAVLIHGFVVKLNSTDTNTQPNRNML
jgi:hypothetical protein